MLMNPITRAKKTREFVTPQKERGQKIDIATEVPEGVEASDHAQPISLVTVRWARIAISSTFH